MRYFVTIHGESFVVELGPSRDGATTARLQDGDSARDHVVELRSLDGVAHVALVVDGASHDVLFEDEARGVHVTLDGVRHAVVIEDERERAAHQAAAARPAGPVTVRSAMPGIVRGLLVKVGDAVAAGQPLVVLEAMKMENEIRADHAGVVRSLRVAVGTPVDSGVELVVLDPPAAAR
jgi:biotin carboxyl carrier protein